MALKAMVMDSMTMETKVAETVTGGFDNSGMIDFEGGVCSSGDGSGWF